MVTILSWTIVTLFFSNQLTSCRVVGIRLSTDNRLVDRSEAITVVLYVNETILSGCGNPVAPRVLKICIAVFWFCCITVASDK